ncbi:Pentatricopeptide repeat-containing protein [Apostasia shenzhenica]|uniref:Pentatricopeptide repeat-containing protein n=1 Tax=Apostasia shenzhenica TaxID=1088818 RepID=A0A2I0B2T5_9ASPA|nr:Pentatricopeptide repeat-containing protein [Apostasia shenzhenica]
MVHCNALHLANLLQTCIREKALLRGKSIHARILTSGFSLDTFLSNCLVELYTQCRYFDSALKTFCSTPNPNIFSWNAILSSSWKSGDSERAHKLFDEMPDRNVVSWNTMISALVQRGSEEKAMGLYHGMIWQGILPTHFTFASVLSACASLTALEDGEQCHGLAVKVGLDFNPFVENSLLALYAKCGSLIDALKLFDEMPEPNEVSFTAMMGGLVQCGCSEEALRLFTRMFRIGVRIDHTAVSSVLSACRSDQSSFSFGQAIHAFSIKLCFESETRVGNSLIDMYAKLGDLERAEFLLKTLPAVNVVTWNILIAGYGQKGDAEKAISTWKLMHDYGFQPDEVTYISMLSACVKFGDTETARQMFDKIKSPSVISWNAILSGYCQNEDHEKALVLFREMQFSNAQPNRTTFAIILSSCSGLGFLDLGKQVHAASVRIMLHEDMFVTSGLVDMYSKCGNIEAARQVFDRMPERDVVSWNSMITGFTHHSLHKEALFFFKLMRENGMSPTESSHASVISSCARLSSLSQGRQIHAHTVKDGFSSDVYVGSSLIDMYTKCGNVADARCFFDGMPMKNVVSWNEMIHGYAQNGHGLKAIELFEHMLTVREKPDSVTFVAVLTACSHSGLVGKGIEFFNLMKNDHGIEPLAEHYTCVLDAMGRAGCLREAELLLNQMTCKDDPIVWEVVLSACVVHGDEELGIRAAKELFRIDPKNSAPYVLLSNIYALNGRWEEASRVRRLMSDNGVVKDKGYSWINQKNGGVNAFMVDDCLGLVNFDGWRSERRDQSDEICIA